MDKYGAKLDALINTMIKTYTRELKALFTDNPPLVTMDASTASQSRILLNSLQSRFAKFFIDKSNDLAKNIFNRVDNASYKNLSESLKELSGGLTIPTPDMPATLKEAMTASIAENVSLIKSIPQEFHRQIEGAVMRSMQPGGNGLPDVINAVERYKGVSHRRAKNIARDQVRKITTACNASRAQAVGIKKFEWLHTGASAESRPHHKDVLNGQIYSFDDLPIIDPKTGERGLPGRLPNCKCSMRPIVDFSEL